MEIGHGLALVLDSVKNAKEKLLRNRTSSDDEALDTAKPPEPRDPLDDPLTRDLTNYGLVELASHLRVPYGELNTLVGEMSSQRRIELVEEISRRIIRDYLRERRPIGPSRHLKKKYKLHRINDNDLASEPNGDEILLVTDAIESLPNHLQILVRFMIEEKELQEIAAVMKISRATAYRYRNEARKILSKFLDAA